jgi:hypothetical protein
MTLKQTAATWFSLGILFGSILAFAACSRDTEPTPPDPTPAVVYANNPMIIR